MKNSVNSILEGLHGKGVSQYGTINESFTTGNDTTFFNQIKNMLRGTGWDYHNNKFTYKGDTQEIVFNTKTGKISSGKKGKSLSADSPENLLSELKKNKSSISDGSKESEKALDSLIKALSKTVNESISESRGSFKITGDSASELKANARYEGFKVDSADFRYMEDRPKAINGEDVTLYKDGVEYTATFNLYSDGKQELINIKKS